MAFNLQESGTREGIMSHLDSLKPDKGVDGAQLDSIKELVRKEIGALPDNKSGVRLNVHATANDTMRTIHVSVIPMEVRA